MIFLICNAFILLATQFLSQVDPDVQTDIKIPAFDKLNSVYRLLICIAVAVAVFFIVEIEHIDMLTHLMIAWDVFSVCMIIMSWITFYITKPKQIRSQARKQDPTAPIIFIVILVSTLASLLAVLILIVQKKKVTAALPIAYLLLSQECFSHGF